MAWKDVNIFKYKKIFELEQDEDWQWNALAILLGTTYEDIITRPIDETMRLSREFLSWSTDKPVLRPVRRQYAIGGRTYDFKGYPKDITTAQYIDFYNCGREVPADLVDMLSVFLVPEGHRYNEGYDMDEIKKEIDENFNIEDALSVCDFFTSLFQVLLRRVTRKARRALKQAQKEGVAPTEVTKALALLKGYRRSVGLR